MAELTPAQVRAFLTGIGLPQVDPQEWIASTLPEILRAMVDLGRISPQMLRTFSNRTVVTSAVNVTQDVTVVAVNPGEIVHVRNFTMILSTAAIISVRIYKEAGPVQTNIWHGQDAGGFPIGPYLGADNTSSVAWAAANRDLYVSGTDLEANNLQQQLHVEVISDFAVIKTFTIDFDIDTYLIQDFPH